MKSRMNVVLLAVFAVASSLSFADHDASGNALIAGHPVVADPAAPERPTSLSHASELVPKASVVSLNKRGDIYCETLKQIESILDKGSSSLPPKVEATAKSEIKTAKVVCNEKQVFIGFPNSGNLNEKLVVDYWSIKNLLGRTSSLIGQVFSGLEFQAAHMEISDALTLLEARWNLHDSKKLSEIYSNLSASDLSKAFQEYQDWADKIDSFYRTQGN